MVLSIKMVTNGHKIEKKTNKKNPTNFECSIMVKSNLYVKLYGWEDFLNSVAQLF